RSKCFCRSERSRNRTRTWTKPPKALADAVRIELLGNALWIGCERTNHSGLRYCSVAGATSPLRPEQPGRAAAPFAFLPDGVSGIQAFGCHGSARRCAPCVRPEGFGSTVNHHGVSA